MTQSKHGADLIATSFTVVSLRSRSQVSEHGIVRHILVGLRTMRRFVDMKKNTELKHGGHLTLLSIMMQSFLLLRENTVELCICLNVLLCSACLN
jgi:hypothetical protein